MGGVGDQQFWCVSQDMDQQLCCFGSLATLGGHKTEKYKLSFFSFTSSLICGLIIILLCETFDDISLQENHIRIPVTLFLVPWSH